MLVTDEILDAFDKQGNYVGTIERKKSHKKNAGVFHKVVHVWFINENNELLIQKRAACKPTCPNRWDIACAGHIESGESILTACERETFEELGLKVKPGDFIYVGELIHEEMNELTEQFIVKTAKDIKDMTLQVEEVSEVKWINIKDFKQLLYSDAFMDHSDDYKYFLSRFLTLHFDR